MDPMAVDAYGDATAGAEGEWTEYFDEDSQARYWFNASSGETTWEQPV